MASPRWNTPEFWAENAHLPANQIAQRHPDKDPANVRRAVRKAREKYPGLPWYRDVRQADTQEATSRPVRRVTPRNGQAVETSTEVVVSDIHAPFHDPRAIGCVLGYLADNPPDGFTIDGDFLDCYALSRFSKDPQRELELQYELDVANAILDAFDDVLPDDCIKRFVIGNHEARMARYLSDNARALHGLRDLTVESQLNLDERGYEVSPMVGRDASCFVGGVEVGHFNKVSKHSAYTAKALVEERGCSVIQAHTHRLGAHYKRLRGNGKQIGGWECGCLCDLNPEYVSNPQWQQGFATITTCSTGRYHVTLHEILGGELLAAGRRY